MFWLGLAIALPTTFLADWVTLLLYGENYSQTGGVLAIHIWAGIFVFLGVASGKWLLAENYVKKSFCRTAFGAIVNLILNLYLIPRYGLKGAAYATFAAQFSASFLYDFFDPDTRISFYMKCKVLLPFKQKYA